MSGHNKWSQIKHKKAKEDSKRGKAFTKLIKEITVAARESGGDPASNAKLRNLMDKARDINMPQDNIVRAIKRGTGELPGVNYEAFTYEGYGPAGIAIIVDTLSDNKNRTVADLRHIFSAKAGNLAPSGSVTWMFARTGVIRGSGSLSEDQILDILIEYDVQDIKDEDGSYTIICDPRSLDNAKNALKSAGFIIESAELEWVAQDPVTISDDQSEKALELLSALQDHDDVQNVYTNLA